MKLDDFTQISRWCHGVATQNGLWNRSGKVQDLPRNRSEIVAESWRNLSMPYPCLIPCNLKVSRRLHAELIHILGRMGCGIIPESLGNLSGTLADSIYALSMLDSMQLKDFTQISCRFYGHWVAQSFRNGSGIVPESKRNPTGILAKSIYALSMLDSMELEDFTQISCRFSAEWVAES